MYKRQVLDDAWMIEAAKGQRTRPVLTFTSIGPDGRFHSSLIHTLLGDLQPVSYTHLSCIVIEVNEHVEINGISVKPIRSKQDEE